MILCITEKPSVARDLARIIGASSRNDGYFEGNGYCVTWTFGHLCTLKEPHDYYPNWKHWSIGSLPMIPPRFGIKLIDQPGIEKQFKVIETLINKCDEIINCGDAGQEGELIQRWVMQKTGCPKPTKRLWISSLTDDAIRDGMANLRPASDFDRLYTAGLCRAIGDWILGINGTRLYTLKYGVNRTILSIGRVQTPTLALIVNRQKEIENFVPTTRWELKTLYRDTIFSAPLKVFKTEEEGKAFIETIKDSPLTVSSVKSRKGREEPPRLFDLTSLQVECNKRLNLSADTTLKTIQSLYEKKVTTYPRVDTTYLTLDLYPKCAGILNSLTHLSDKMSPLRGRPLRKNKKVFDNSKVTDHHAIIPTGQPLPSLTDTERAVFDMIALRFLGVFYPDCLFEQTTVEAQVDKVKFKATGKVITDPGWRALYAKEKEEATVSKDEDSGVLPEFTVGESGPHKPRLAKKTTQPPPYYTEGTLLKAMETAGSKVEDEELREALKANGIGRPSTRAAIIEILFKRGYIRRERKSLKATDAGINLINVIQEDLLKSAELTGIWEGRLRDIEKGEYSPQEFIDKQKMMINEITLAVMHDNSGRKIDSPEPEKRKTSKKK